MKTIILTAEQSAKYDNDDMSIIDEILKSEGCVRSMSDREPIIEIYHEEGFVVALGYSE